MAFLHEHIILPLSDLATGQRVHYYLRKLRKAETWSKDRMHAFQQQRLQQLLKYAAKEVPFYREWFAARGFDPAHTTLEQLPIVNKTIMRQAGIERFTAEHFPHLQRIASRSSGSTGEPFSFYTTQEESSVNTASKILTWQKAGYQMGEKYMKIAYMPRGSRMKRMQDYINNCHYVFFDSMDDQRLQDIMLQIEAYRPLYLRSYPMPILMLARYRMQHPEFTHRFHRIFTTGATLTHNERQVIEAAFGCDIIDSYSCEGTPNNAETPAHDGYHTCRYFGIVEILDDNNIPVTDGIGRVVSTDLWNCAHPFLRYDTQDMVEIHNGTIQRIVGRQSESIISPNGVSYTIYSFMSYFEHELESVDAYQVVRCPDGSITFRLVVNSQYTPETEQYIINHWQQRLVMPVSVSVVDNIPLMHNNKHLTIVNE